jgi:hypothetical protein
MQRVNWTYNRNLQDGLQTTADSCLQDWTKDEDAHISVWMLPRLRIKATIYGLLLREIDENTCECVGFFAPLAYMVQIGMNTSQILTFERSRLFELKFKGARSELVRLGGMGFVPVRLKML